MDTLKISIIGCGMIANAAHIPAYLKNPETEIVWFCDIKAERAESAVKRYGTGKATTDYMDVLADPQVDAVSVCTPNVLHSEISCAALEAGKHVLCEKPAAINYEEAMAMERARDDAGLILNIGVCNRFNDSVRKIKGLIDEGRLGNVYHVYASFRAHRSIPGLGGDFTTKSVVGGGALIDWGVHYLDIVMFCMGDPAVKTVSCEVFSELGRDMEQYAYTDMWAGPPRYDGTYDVDDSVTALVRTEGPVLTVHGAWAQNISEKETYIDFMGDKAGIRLQYGGNFTLYSSEDGALTRTEYGIKQTDMYENEIASFIACVRTGERNAADVSTAMVTTRMMQAMYDSAEIHREVVLD